MVMRLRLKMVHVSDPGELYKYNTVAENAAICLSDQVFYFSSPLFPSLPTLPHTIRTMSRILFNSRIERNLDDDAMSQD